MFAPPNFQPTSGFMSAGGGSSGMPLTTTILPTRTTGIAPMGVIFDLSYAGGGVTNPTKDTTTFWNYGDSGSTYSVIASGHPHGNDANTSIGQGGSHTFPAGTHTVTAVTYYVQDGVIKVATATIDVTATADSAAFAAWQTVVCSVSGDFTGAPAGATQITGVGALAAELTIRNFDSKFRLLFHRGETFELSNFSYFIRDVGQFYMGAYGTGAAPVLSVIDRTDLNVFNIIRAANCLDTTVTGLSFYGGYDPDNHTLTGTYRRQNVQFDSYNQLTIDSCIFRGLHTSLNIFQFNSSRDGVTVLNNNHISDWSDYGCLSANGHFAATGNHIKQSANAAFGVVGKGETASATAIYADHGPMRTGSTTLMKDFTTPRLDIHIGGDYFSRGGWSAYNTTTAHQPCLRINMDATINFRRGCATRNRFQGGSVMSAASDAAFARNYGNAENLFDSNYYIGDEQTDLFLTFGMFGAVVRNNVAYKPNLSEDGTASGGSYQGFVSFHRPNTTQIGTEAETTIAFNTIISDQTVANTDFSTSFLELRPISPITNTVVGDNVVRATGNSNVADFPNDNPLDAANYYRPQAGSSALGAATLTAPLFDFKGNPRTLTGSARGAWHSSS